MVRDNPKSAGSYEVVQLRMILHQVTQQETYWAVRSSLTWSQHHFSTFHFHEPINPFYLNWVQVRLSMIRSQNIPNLHIHTYLSYFPGTHRDLGGKVATDLLIALKPRYWAGKVRSSHQALCKPGQWAPFRKEQLDEKRVQRGASIRQSGGVHMNIAHSPHRLMGVCFGVFSLIG